MNVCAFARKGAMAVADRALAEVEGAEFGVPPRCNWTGIKGVDGCSEAEKLAERLRKMQALLAGLVHH